MIAIVIVIAIAIVIAFEIAIVIVMVYGLACITNTFATTTKTFQVRTIMKKRSDFACQANGWDVQESRIRKDLGGPIGCEGDDWGAS